MAPQRRHEQHLAAVPDRVHDTERDRGRRDLDDQDRGGGHGPHRRLPGRDTADLRVRRAELRQHGLPRRRIHHAVDPGDGATQAVHFEFNTTGTPGGKNNSHGDAKAIDDQVGVTNNGDANGDFNLAQASLTVADDQALQKNRNPQATTVTVNALAVGAAVGDSPTLTTPCNATLTAGFPSFFSCSLLTSLTSTVEVGNGKTFNNANGAGTPGIKVIVSFAKAPSQLSGANKFVYHYWTDTAGAHAELITATCTIVGGFPSNTGPCLVVGNGNVTVWLTHNGNMRM